MTRQYNHRSAPDPPKIRVLDIAFEELDVFDLTYEERAPSLLERSAQVVDMLCGGLRLQKYVEELNLSCIPLASSLSR
jgi:hypothetical protein